MSDRLESRLREALASRADYGMTYTDTQKELQRFKNRLAGHRRTRRIQLTIGLTGVAAATVAIIALAMVFTNGSDRTGTQPGVSPSQTPASAVTLPPDYPAGTWVRLGPDQQQGRLTLGDNALARLQDVVGFNDEHLNFPAPHRMTFGASVGDIYCTTSGDYVYTMSHQRLHFRLIKDSCDRRRAFLTQSTWQEVHS